METLLFLLCRVVILLKSDIIILQLQSEESVAAGLTPLLRSDLFLLTSFEICL